jgi:hypothetical protein
MGGRDTERRGSCRAGTVRRRRDAHEGGLGCCTVQSIALWLFHREGTGRQSDKTMRGLTSPFAARPERRRGWRPGVCDGRRQASSNEACGETVSKWDVRRRRDGCSILVMICVSWAAKNTLAIPQTSSTAA